jgi:hypothetical protein
MFRLNGCLQRTNRPGQQTGIVSTESNLRPNVPKPALHQVDHILLVSELRINTPTGDHHDCPPRVLGELM